MRHRGHPPRLFWRVYLNGLLLLALVAVALGVVGALVGRGQMVREPGRLARYAAERLGELRGDPARLAAELRRASEAFGVDLAVYEDGGRLVAASGDAPPPPVPPAERRRLDAGPVHLAGPPFAWGARIPGEPPAHAVLAAGRHAFPLTRGAAFLAALLAALALASIPLARAIARPLERLTAAARRLGAGDLSARSGLRRGDEVGELARAFDEMADRLERLVRSEKELLANVSHELRTPLSRIRVALEIAAEGDAERARRGLAEIGADLAELERLLDDVLTAARLELASGRAGAGVPLRIETVEAGELLARAAANFRSAHPGRDLVLREAPGLPSLEADGPLLRRAVDNLLDNAAKYSPGETPVTLEARGEAGFLVVEVRDLGMGIDPADQPRLFTPFFRSDRSRSRGTGGVGLGLALVRRIAEVHGGTAALEPDPAGGTVARLRIPAAGVPAPAAQ
jgi:two-component system OmpR family sensor kinase